MGRLKGRLAITALALALSALCLQSIIALNTSTRDLTESEQTIRNQAASALYAKLATLPQPATLSDITRTVHDFISNDVHADGATLYAPQGRLFAQLGQGNDLLLEQPFGQSMARIPIRTGDTHAGHILLSFQPTRSNAESVFHYAAIATALVLLSILVIALLSHGARTLLSMVSTPVDSA